MEPKPDSDELIEPILNFRIDLGRIQVPTTEGYPTGEGVLLAISQPVNDSDPNTEWVTKHYLLPPDAAKGISVGLNETADEARGTGLYVPGQ